MTKPRWIPTEWDSLRHMHRQNEARATNEACFTHYFGHHFQSLPSFHNAPEIDDLNNRAILTIHRGDDRFESNTLLVKHIHVFKAYMNIRRNAFQIFLCAVSALVFCILGMLGESLLNIFHMLSDGKGAMIPMVTDVALSFLLNRNHFLFSMTPFMIAVAGLALLYRDRPLGHGFVCWFAAVWLMVIVYFLLFATALTLPFFTLGADFFSESPVPTVVYLVNGMLVIFIILMVFLRAKERAGKA